MIKEIHRIYIIDSKAKPIYIRENYVQGSGSVDHALMSSFISALETFVREIENQNTEAINLHNEKIFISKDQLTTFLFILCCDPNTKPKKMFKILNDIKNLFINKFTGHFMDSIEEKKKIMNSFLESLDEILEPSSKHFLDNL